MSSSTDEGKGSGLLEFLAWAGRTGEMAPATAGGWAATCRKVLAIEDDPDAVDLRSIDVDDFFDRFEALNRTKYSAGSMSTYRSRFRQATTAYLAWLENDPTWKPSKRSSSRPKRSNSAEKEDSSPADTPEPAAPEVPHAKASARLMTYTVPLRPDVMVSLSLPADLTTRDADRLAAFLRSLAFEVDEPGGGLAPTGSN